jgi:cell division protein FtsB
MEAEMEELKTVIIELLLNWLGYDVHEQENKDERYRKLTRRYMLLERENEKLKKTVRQLHLEMQEVEAFAAVLEKAHMKLRGEVRRSRRGFARRPAKIH